MWLDVFLNDDPADGQGLVGGVRGELLLRWREVARESHEHTGHAHANCLAHRHLLVEELPGPEQARHGHERLRHRHVLRVALDQEPEEDESYAVQDGGASDADALLQGQRIRPELAAVQPVVDEHDRGRDAHEDHVRPRGGRVARHPGDDGPIAEADGGNEDEDKEEKGLRH